MSACVIVIIACVVLDFSSLCFEFVISRYDNY